MDKLEGVSGLTRIDKIRNDQIKEVCDVKNVMNEGINECVLRLFVHM